MGQSSAASAAGAPPVCANCRAANPPQARYCNQCGAPLAAAANVAANRGYTPPHLAERVLTSRAALIGERKRVTVLFADIKGSTSLAEAAGIEEWHAILERFFAILTAAVHRYEGTVNQYTGDGIMALFGAPLALEDHARRAGLAALEMQREVRAWADELRLRSGLSLSLRIGLNSGEVVVGAIGDDLRMDYTAQGATVHLAARMESICEPGRIYLTRHTAALVEGYFRLRDLGVMRIAGAEAPVRVYELEGEGPLRTRLERGLMRGAGRLVGREAELVRLRQLAARARARHGVSAAVVGEAGIGKSRLCHEFAAECERQGLAVHAATGVPYAAALPFHPVQTLVRSRLGLNGQDAPEQQRRLAAGALSLFDLQAVTLLARLLEFLGVVPPPADAAPADRRRLFEWLARFLPRADGPQVLLVEDLHFADAGSLAFFEMLTREVQGTSTLLLFNFRPDFTASWLGQMHERFELTPLSAAQLEDLGRELLGGHDSVRDLPGRLAARADGNPFYLEEAVHALAEAGHLQGMQGAYRMVRPIESWPIPDTVHALVAARIDRLDEAHKSLLQAAAVIGQTFAADLLAELAGLPGAACEARLARLRELGLVCLDDAARYRFAHPLIQDVAYRTQLEKHRAAAHARLAELLEREHPLSAPPREAAAVIAHHWRRAGQWLRAAQWNLQAARWAANQGANAMLEQYRLAHKNLERGPHTPATDHLRVEALAGLVRMAQFAATPTAEVEEAYAQARHLAQSNRDTPALAELLISHAAVRLQFGDAQAAVGEAEAAVRLALAAQARELVHRFRLPLLLIYGTAGYPRAGLAAVNQAAGESWLVDPVGEENYLSRALHALILVWFGRLREARAENTAVLEYAKREQRTLSWMHVNAIDLACFDGEYAGVLQHAEQALALAESWGSAYFRAIALRGLGLAHLLRNEAATAVAALESALPLVAPGALAHSFEANTLQTLARAYLGAGDLARAHETARRAIESAQRARAPVWELMAWLAFLELPPGGDWAARVPEALARADALMRSTGAEGGRPWWWLARARWASQAGEREAARSRALESFRANGAQAHAQRYAAQWS
jgi:class 3 adenylate cyclase